ncbi:hypothetical protein SKAU_G00208110 [Synaphobranchus kaupii]|uniref:Uncharacterized protein n=1 Tax=Synaphobranchus kaupii TaxID=118154 RepID=A0A9Q1F872_SYNKA|nr:hypothetical protein SKAU_G00208110 [Synaphobranchus kaupii]
MVSQLLQNGGMASVFVKDLFADFDLGRGKVCAHMTTETFILPFDEPSWQRLAGNCVGKDVPALSAVRLVSGPVPVHRREIAAARMMSKTGSRREYRGLRIPPCCMRVELRGGATAATYQGADGLRQTLSASSPLRWRVRSMDARIYRSARTRYRAYRLLPQYTVQAEGRHTRGSF